MKSIDAPFFTLRRLGLTLAVALAYAGFGWLELSAVSLGTINSWVDPIWLPAGVALAAMLLWGKDTALGVLLGSLATAFMSRTPWPAALLIAIGNLGGAWLAAGLLRRWGFGCELRRIRDVLLLLLVAPLAPVVDALVGVSALRWGGLISPASYWFQLLVWEQGDLFGILLLTPLVLTIAGRRSLHRLGQRGPEVLLLLGGTLAAGSLDSVLRLADSKLHLALPLPVMPFVIWAALRFAQTGVMLVSSIAAGLALRDVSRFTPPTPGVLHALMFLQLDLAVVTFSGLFLAAAISEGREAEMELQQSERRYREIVEMAGEGIWRLDGDGNTVFANRRLAQMLGYEVAELRGKPAIDLIHPEDHHNYRLRQVQRRQGVAGPHETRLVHRDGHVVWVRNVANPLWNDDGSYAGALGMLTDISEQRIAEQALRESEQQYRHLFEHNAQPMWIYDPATFNFLAVNQAALALYGYSRDEFASMTLKDVRPAHDVAALVDLQPAPIDGPAHRSGVFRHRTRDGRLLHVELQTRALEFNGQPARHVMIQDITERMRLEGQMRQAHKMEAVGRLAGGIAHDFNNLLTVISGYTDLLLRRQLGSPVEQEWLRGVQTAAQRAAALTGQLLAFGRQQLLAPQTLAINQVIEDSMSMLRRVIREDIRLVTELDPAAGWICADSGQLEQVLVNLVINARDAMPQGGEVRLVTGTRALTGDGRTQICRPDSIPASASATPGWA